MAEYLAVTALLAWGITEVTRRRSHVRVGPVGERKASAWSVLVIAAAGFEIGLLLLLLAP